MFLSLCATDSAWPTAWVMSMEPRRENRRAGKRIMVERACRSLSFHGYPTHPRHLRSPSSIFRTTVPPLLLPLPIPSWGYVSIITRNTARPPRPNKIETRRALDYNAAATGKSVLLLSRGAALKHCRMPRSLHLVSQVMAHLSPRPSN